MSTVRGILCSALVGPALQCADWCVAAAFQYEQAPYTPALAARLRLVIGLVVV